MVGKVGLLLWLFAMRSTLGVPMSEFFPYGDRLNENNQRLGNGDSSHGCIFLHELFHFCGRIFLDLCVGIDGGIAFGNKPISYTSQSFPLGGEYHLVAPFFSDINTRSQGDVWFRESEVPELLAKADECVKQGFPSSSFSATHLIIATWDNVSAADTLDGMGNTFQVVLATDGKETYAVFLYADNGIQWGRTGGINAQAGISCGSNDRGFQGSGRNAVSDLDDNTNVGEAGKYVICLNDNSVPLCDVQSVNVSVTNERRRDVDVTFSAAPSQADAAFECSLDGGNFKSCTSPRTYKRLSRGNHFVTVRAQCPSNASRAMKREDFSIGKMP